MSVNLDYLVCVFYMYIQQDARALHGSKIIFVVLLVNFCKKNILMQRK